MANFGYCCLNIDEKAQKIYNCRNELRKQGVEEDHLFVEFRTETNNRRPELTRLFKAVNKNDVIYTVSLDTLAKSTIMLSKIFNLVKEKQAKLVINDTGFTIDCTKEKLDEKTQAVFDTMGMFLSLEKPIVVEVPKRYSNKKQKTLKIKDIPKPVKKYHQMYLDRQINKTEYARLCDISITTLNRYLKVLEST